MSLGDRVRLVTFERHLPAQTDTEADHRLASFGAHHRFMDALDVSRPGVRRLGALLTDGSHAGDIVDLNRALAAKLACEDVGAPEAEADSLLPADALSFLRRMPQILDVAQEALSFVDESLADYDTPDLERLGVVESRRHVRLCAPIPRPGKILAVARNYAEHAREAGSQIPDGEPILFLKAPSSVIGPEAEIVLPKVAERVDYEGELAVVIGRPARRVPSDEAIHHVAGYTVANDVSARDFQNARGQHFIGKSCDTFCPLGPALVTPDEISDPQDLGIRTILSSEVVQSARTKEMIHSIAEIIAFASSLMTLNPGDVVLTGTPAGVGAARKPPRWLREGDVVEVQIEAVGRLCNYVREEPRSAW